MNNKVIEIVDCADDCCYIAKVHSLSLSRNVNSIDEYVLIAKLKNEICCNPIQVTRFYHLNIRYLLLAKHKEFLISIERAQIKSFDQNTIIFFSG